MATSRSALLVLAMAAAALVGTAMAVDHTVGAPKGSWDLQTNYAQWASALTFRAGDQLVFQYSAAQHDVVEVSKADYDACSASSPITTLRTGNDVVQLAAAGTRYFICGVPGHCTGGMKVQVNVEAASAGGAPSPVSTPAARGPAAAAAPSAKTPATPSSSPASVGAASLGGAVAVAALTMMLFN